MAHGTGRSVCRNGALLAALTIGIAAAPAPVFAQGFLDALFGSFHRHRAPPQSNALGDPFGMFTGPRQRASGESFGHGQMFCVRTCDGRYFPLQHHVGMTPIEACRAFCPAAKTMVFSGSKIDTAVAPNGARYADLDNAFAYRDKVIDHCSCNGKNGMGLARVDAGNDPTLRPGDIVATTGGLATYNGNKPDGEFTPINTSSSEWARRLADVKVEPGPPPETIAPVENDSPKPVRKSRARAASR